MLSAFYIIKLAMFLFHFRKTHAKIKFNIILYTQSINILNFKVKAISLFEFNRNLYYSCDHKLQHWTISIFQIQTLFNIVFCFYFYTFFRFCRNSLYKQKDLCTSTVSFQCLETYFLAFCTVHWPLDFQFVFSFLD